MNWKTSLTTLGAAGLALTPTALVAQENPSEGILKIAENPGKVNLKIDKGTIHVKGEDHLVLATSAKTGDILFFRIPETLIKKANIDPKHGLPAKNWRDVLSNKKNWAQLIPVARISSTEKGKIYTIKLENNNNERKIIVAEWLKNGRLDLNFPNGINIISATRNNDTIRASGESAGRDGDDDITVISKPNFLSRGLGNQGRDKVSSDEGNHPVMLSSGKGGTKENPEILKFANKTKDGFNIIGAGKGHNKVELGDGKYVVFDRSTSTDYEGDKSQIIAHIKLDDKKLKRQYKSVKSSFGKGFLHFLSVLKKNAIKAIQEKGTIKRNLHAYFKQSDFLAY